MAKILVSDPIDAQCAEIFKGEGFDVVVKTGLSTDDLKKIIPEYEALVVRSSTKVTADIISAATKLKMIGRAGAGVDNIDVAAATRRGIIVMNTPGGNTISTAEHTISMMLSLARNIPQADQSLKKGEWNRKKYVGVELFEKTLGVLGLGKVGKEVAIRCASFGMKILAYDPILSPEAAREIGVELVGLPELLGRSDFITIHTPLTNETRNVLNDISFATCKRGVRIVNCARGGIIDEPALLRALESGQVGGAALDVFAEEPPGESKLIHHPNVVVTPHLGASTEEAQEKVAIQIAHQLCDALKGRGVVGGVNADVLNVAMRSDLQPYFLLAEKLGKLAIQLMDGNPASLYLRIQGRILAESTKALSAAFLKGFLSGHLDEPLNYLNAPVIAGERGIRLEIQQDGEHSHYTNLLTAGYETERERRTFAGTVFGSNSIRIVKVDGFHFETNPEGHMLFYSNIDRPGIVAAVSSILAAAKINIAGMSLGRYGIGKEALMIMTVDSEIPPNTLVEIAKINGLIWAKTVFL